MAVITLHGTVINRGVGEYGEWCIVAEPNVKRDGERYEKRFMTSAAKGESAPAVGAVAVVTGFAQCKVREYDGNHYADINVQAAHYFAVAGEASGDSGTLPVPAPDLDGEEIPF